jgi:DNA-binding transcriptional ArsR family regulator
MLKQSPALTLMFKALADPTRRALIDRLARGAASVSELARPFPMSLPAVHQHLRVLEEAGLMKWSKEGRVRRCRLEPRALDGAAGWIMQRRAAWNRRLDALARHLKEGTP